MSRILDKMMIIMVEGLVSALILYFFAKNFSQIIQILKELFSRINLSKIVLRGK
ncbi:MAG: hypothetical protein QXS21_00965 [Thermoproteota archaeon]|nr:hypothetical protein [Candidatus Brockarchaeota archaeon]MBO3768331.1 hypothetical protein [Candidatus Brockarchaeota archaeon]MBO3800983.1 hypothetical protein [Candidatus Brockarchaeota archaeon]